MRNLNLIRNTTIEDSFLSDLSKCLIITESSTSKVTKIFVTNKYTEVYMLTLTGNSSFENTFVADLAQFADHLLELPSVVDCNYVFNELYVILSSGYLVTIVVNGESDENETLGQNLEVGTTEVVSWSPDFERTVLINSNGVLFVLTIAHFDFEKLNELFLQDESEEQKKFLNVGWGSEETQFRGSEGKFSKNTPKETVIENSNDVCTSICWKPNGTAFAVNYVCLAEKRRKIKVFSQDGILLNVTKDISGLQSPMDWCLSKNLIFCPQVCPNKKVISFLEENALKHGDFRLAEDTEVKELLWNSSGLILACHGIANDHEYVALWTTSNYKWYMKQNLIFNEPITCLQWDFLSPNRLHVILNSGVYRFYDWAMQVDESSKYGGENNKAIVASIQGHQLHVIPYAFVNQPPSMPFKTFELSPSCINAVVFPEAFSVDAGDFDCNSMILYLNSDRLRFLKSDKLSDVELKFSVAQKQIKFSTPAEISAFIWILPNIFYFSWCKTEGNYFCVSHFDFEKEEVVVTECFPVKAPIIATCTFNKDAIVHLDNGNLYIYRDGALRLMKMAFVEPCTRLQMLNENTLIALSENRNLYVNETIKWRDVTSFYWKPPFIILLTMDSQLLISKVNLSGGEASFDEVLSRNVEPKSSLATVMGDRVILEMERGNLETIVPRTFTIFDMEEKLKKGLYFEALKMLRKQRINLNVLFDHDPISFVNNIKDIINNVSDPMYLLTFITELEDENVAASMFPWKYGNAKSIPNKVGMICDTLCTAIKETTDSKLMAPLIAALVKQNKLAEAAKYAIEYHEVSTLIHLSDPIVVYRAALGSFDLSNALQIIQHSKLDPSEYLPFIHELQTMEENYRKFKICDHLEDYPAALVHLANCVEDAKFDECVAYMNKHQLYRTALEIFNAKSKESEKLKEIYTKILSNVAEFYFKNQCYTDAGILFEKAHLNDKALKCYLIIGDWFSAISISKCMHSDAENVVKTAREVYDVLRKRGKHEDAGLIAYHFICDSKLAIDAFLFVRKYLNAINAARGLKKDEAITDIIQPAVVEDAKLFISQFDSKLAPLVAYKERLQEIRENKNDPERDNEDDRQSVVSSSDGSDASSISSTNSRASSASSTAKRARRRERRLWNLKPGNRREEPSLLNVIRQTVTQYEKEYIEIIPDLIKALIKTDELVLARELKNSYEKFLLLIRKIVDAVWSGLYLPEGGAGYQDLIISCPPDITPFVNDLSLFNSK